MDSTDNKGMKMLRMAQVVERTALSRAAIYAKQNPKDKRRYDPTFPTSIKISTTAVAWLEHEIDAWIAARVAASRTNTSKGVTA